MGTVTQSMAKSAKNYGAEIETNATVKRIVYDDMKSSDRGYYNSKPSLFKVFSSKKSSTSGGYTGGGSAHSSE